MHLFQWAGFCRFPYRKPVHFCNAPYYTSTQLQLLVEFQGTNEDSLQQRVEKHVLINGLLFLAIHEDLGIPNNSHLE